MEALLIILTGPGLLLILEHEPVAEIIAGK